MRSMSCNIVYSEIGSQLLSPEENFKSDVLKKIEFFFERKN